jgi:aspartyl-tRNA(Asn)/glutamyl-tRNA(Gln) amidotransferase subunit A
MYKLSALEIHELFINNQVSSTEIVEYFIKRIKKYDPQLKAFLSILEERSLVQAKKLDQKRKDKKPLGKMAGIPLVLKDNMHVKGETTTAGSKILQNYKAPFDATVTELFEQEDALIIGKTNLDEFAMGSSTENSAYFPTHNPWNLKCVPGGSSGGSAAAVSARLGLLATGSDTGGSIRQPAALCNLVGFKPTYGRVSRYGLVAFGSSLDQIGPLGLNVSDVALTMEVIGKHSPKDATSIDLPQENYLSNLRQDLKGVKVGVPFKLIENLKSELAKNFQDSITVLKKLGAEIVEVNLDILQYSMPVYYILAPAEASTNLARFDGIKYGFRSKNAKTLDQIYDLSRDEGFGAEVKRRILMGTFVLSAGFQDAYYKKAQKVRTLIIQAFNEAFNQCDVICVPTSPSSAFEMGAKNVDPIQLYLEDLYTIPANLAGVPAISIPSGFTKDQKPLGIQFMGPQLHDVSVVTKAYAFEKATNYSKKIPPLFDKE